MASDGPRIAQCPLVPMLVGFPPLPSFDFGFVAVQAPTWFVRYYMGTFLILRGQ